MQSSFCFDERYEQEEFVYSPIGAPRMPIPPRETEEQKRVRVMNEIEAGWARREAIINDVHDNYSKPLRILGRMNFYKRYPAAKEAQRQQERDLIEWHRKLPRHCVQANSYGEIVGISRFLQQEIPTAFYRTTAKSLFAPHAYYEDPSQHRDQRSVSFRSSSHHMEHHREVNRIADHPDQLPAFYKKFVRKLNRIKREIKRKEQQVAGDLLTKQEFVTPFPIYVVFGVTPKPCFIHPAFAPCKIGSNPKLPAAEKYKLPESLKRRELEIHFPNLRQSRRRSSSIGSQCSKATSQHRSSKVEENIDEPDEAKVELS
ncbi:hypothetical protein C0Q70_06865 [Pomacea canaliculata]|uniref:Uncharacterized protein n=1 Tax=Pomacea canaliculata TaxID=400727 RepID=A0A2T7PDG1_POMCA|nr:uncharacterized protein LOC112562785 [Pomacea canaliculata]PVD31453.1 hypothetical protein C0Q70_06865 [Pomacea canaliculata]